MMELRKIAVASILISIVCLVIILADIFRHPQKMKIMNVVWPITALYSGPLALLVYYTIGRNKKDGGMHHSAAMHTEGMSHNKKPFWQSVVIGTLHCGAGCTLGDMVSEGFLVLVPIVVFGSELYGGWVVSFVFAFLIGIVFQYFAIKPMRQLSTGKAIAAALKADTLSLLFWQIGMYGWMAICAFLIFGHPLQATSPVFWFMMQIAMVVGFFTAYPINWFLIKSGVKEAM